MPMKRLFVYSKLALVLSRTVAFDCKIKIILIRFAISKGAGANAGGGEVWIQFYDLFMLCNGAGIPLLPYEKPPAKKNYKLIWQAAYSNSVSEQEMAIGKNHSLEKQILEPKTSFS